MQISAYICILWYTHMDRYSRYGSTQMYTVLLCFLSRLKIAKILHQCTPDIACFLTRPESKSHFTGYTTRMICHLLLSFAQNLYMSVIKKELCFPFLSIPTHSFPFLSLLSQPWCPKFCIIQHNVDNSLQLQVSNCKMNRHVWSGSTSCFCGSSYFFIIQSSFSHVLPCSPMFFPCFPMFSRVFPMVPWWTIISPRVFPDLFPFLALFASPVPPGHLALERHGASGDELVMGGYRSVTSKCWGLTCKTRRFLRIASFCSIESCGGIWSIDVLTLSNYCVRMFMDFRQRM